MLPLLSVHNVQEVDVGWRGRRNIWRLRSIAAGAADNYTR